MDEFVLLRIADDGRICLFDERDEFMASFKNGKWVNDAIFQNYELEEFTIIEDDEQILKVLNEARAVLGVPFVNS